MLRIPIFLLLLCSVAFWGGLSRVHDGVQVLFAAKALITFEWAGGPEWNIETTVESKSQLRGKETLISLIPGLQSRYRYPNPREEPLELRIILVRDFKGGKNPAEIRTVIAIVE
jgi:hypothetical protein